MLANSYLLLTFLATLLPQDPAPRQPAGEPPTKSAPTPTQDPLIATVGEKEVRLSDLIEEVNRQIPLNYYHRRVPPGKMAEFQREAFDTLVVKHLIHLDAVDAGLEVPEAEIRATFENALREAGGQYAKLQSEAKEAFYAEVRHAVLRRALIEKNEQLLVARMPQVDEKMVREIYDERVAADDTAFMAPKEGHFLHIFVQVDPSRIRAEEQEKKAKIEAALAEIEKGTPFADVARTYSEDEFAAKGGDIGYQKAGSFRMKSLNEHAFELDKGQTSAVIRSLHGFHLLRCIDLKLPHRYTFDEMRGAIEGWLQEEHLKIARGKWLADLRSRYKVELLRPDLLEAPEDAEQGSGKGDAAKPEAKEPGKQ